MLQPLSASSECQSPAERLPSLRPRIIGYATVLALRPSLVANRQSMTDDLFRAIVEAYCLRQIFERLVPVFVYATRFSMGWLPTWKRTAKGETPTNWRFHAQ